MHALLSANWLAEFSDARNVSFDRELPLVDRLAPDRSADGKMVY